MMLVAVARATAPGLLAAAAQNVVCLASYELIA
jgi:hypothetical protein